MRWEAYNNRIKTTCPYRNDNIGVGSSRCFSCEFFIRDLGGNKIQNYSCGDIICKKEEDEKTFKKETQSKRIY